MIFQCEQRAYLNKLSKKLTQKQTTSFRQAQTSTQHQVPSTKYPISKPQHFNLSTYFRTLITQMQRINTDKISANQFHPCMPGAKRRSISVPFPSFVFLLLSFVFPLIPSTKHPATSTKHQGPSTHVDARSLMPEG